MTDSQQIMQSAMEVLQSGDVKSAIELFEQALAMTPADFDALHILGVLEHRQGHCERAESLIRQALEVNPQFPEAHYNLGRVLDDLNRGDEAIASYRIALSLNSNMDAAWFNLGLAHERRQNLNEAAEAYRNAIRVNAEDADYHFNLGNIYFVQKDPVLAIESYDAALNLNPSYYMALNNRGIAYRELGNLERAIDSYQKAIGLRPDFGDAYFNLGNAYEAAGNLQWAGEAYETAIDYRPDMTKAHNNLGNVYYSLGQWDKALSEYETAVTLDPDSESAQHMLHSLKGENANKAPDRYVATLFDKAATDFEDRLVNDLKYDSPRELREELSKLVSADKRFANALDLGCGTGLSGAAFRSIADRLTGVDLSSRMVALAKAKGIYQELAVGEILDYLQGTEESFDLFLAADVLAYLGDLSALFEAVRRRALPSAYFLFTLEGVEGQDYVLRKTGRFAHSRPYIERLAMQLQFHIEVCAETVIRTENDKPITGMNLILKCL
ncbi:MAG: tetratricopeptide repeat protein [Candidatus Nitrohelix vancouverensis]|uniref:Tetratricopeptide repeat protein n=1 Tax=Candidatus Nitrohelix vancouverensis TaxID=2705534 RepID=A0A7T0C259_9BACT|nr:MAG: tetratricopeptide repeat protein [Candidatus Nitrohelix vancouverensis]